MSLLKVGRPSHRKEKILASLEDADTGLVRININIKKELHRALKQHALDKETTITSLIINALDQYLK